MGDPVAQALTVIVGRGHPNDVAFTSSTSKPPVPVHPNDKPPPVESRPLAAANQIVRQNTATVLDEARRKAQELVTELQVDFLGPVFTRVALRKLGFVDPEDTRTLDAFGCSEPAGKTPLWGCQARAAVREALESSKAGMSNLWFDRYGPHERRVLCWFSYDIQIQLSDMQDVLHENGRIADYNFDEHRAMVKRGEETLSRYEAASQAQGIEVLVTLNEVRVAQEWLQGLFAQHDRAGHAERQALLEVVLDCITAIRRLNRQDVRQFRRGEAEASISQGIFDGSLGACIRGKARLFVCHFCCISCLAAISNFSRRFPLLELYVDYDDCWETRLLDL